MEQKEKESCTIVIVQNAVQILCILFHQRRKINISTDKHVELINKIKDFATQEGYLFQDIKQLIDITAKEEEHKQVCNLAETNADLKGRYFKSNKEYYKVLSYQSQNEYQVECLTFDKDPNPVFKVNTHKSIQAGDGFLGQFSFSGFTTKSIMSSVVRDMEEITKEEFEEAAKDFLDKLLSMEWKTQRFEWE